MSKLRPLAAAVALAIAAVLPITLARPAYADSCVSIASPSLAIHMTSLYSVNGGYWEELWNVNLRVVQYVYAYGYWVEGWYFDQLYMVPQSRITGGFGC